MVILVGIAARLVTSDAIIATMAAIKKIMLEPLRMIANRVMGVTIQPWPAKIPAVQPKRFDSWALDHSIKRVHNDVFATLSEYAVAIVGFVMVSMFVSI